MLANILGIGIATLDIINSVDHYPREDEEMRAITQRICRGGNVTNTLAVLSQYGHTCYWAGVLCDDNDAKYITNDLDKNNISYQYSQQLNTGKIPTSYITLNKKNGSRTIVHYRDLPELSFAHFQEIPVAEFDWIHFEARDALENLKMISWIKEEYPEIPISIEIEKKRDNIELLFDAADLYLFSRNYANHCGFDDAKQFLKKQSLLQKNKSLICAWGEQGAYALINENQFIHQTAFKVDNVIDTLGAGDTFNAGIINARMSQCSWEKSLEKACRLAAKKCEQQGFDNLLSL